MNTGYTTTQAVRVSGLKRPMIDYLCRSQIVVPSIVANPGRGRARVYSFGDLVMLRVVSELLGAGISVARLRRSLAGLRRRHREFTPDSLPGRYLVCAGGKLYLHTRDGLIEDLSSDGQLALSIVIGLSEVRTTIVERLAAAA